MKQHQKTDKLKSLSKLANTTASNEGIDLDNLYKTFEDDHSEMLAFVSILLSDLQDVKHDLQNAIDQKDLSQFDQLAHKLNTIIQLLKAARLKNLLADGRLMFTIDADEKLPVLKANIIKEIDLYINALQNLLPEI